MTSFQAPRGTHDALPPESEAQERVVRAAEDTFRRFGYRRIETPAFEHTEVFERGLDVGSDIVTKEMYTFHDKGGRSLTLRPEGTAPVVRAAIERGLDRGPLPVKLYYAGPMFRHERPQAGRYRQFTQVGVEALGSSGPEIDAEVVALGWEVFRVAGVEPVTLTLNSIGHPGCREAYRPALVAYLESRSAELCADCRRRIHTNPLRTFDCKEEADRAVMREAPLIPEFLCAECRDHFEAVQGLLKDGGVAFDLDPRLVRGLDYYTRTTFSYLAAGLGAQNEVGGGGRYDGLSEVLEGGPLPGIGFALGVERVLMARGAPAEPEGLDVYVAALGPEASRRAFLLAMEIRAAGMSADLDFGRRGLGAQLKAAARAGARRVVVIGDRGIAQGTYTVRDMATGQQEEVPAAGVVADLRAKR